MKQALVSAILLICLTLNAAADAAKSSAADFVRSFYEWYPRFAQAEHQAPPFESVLKHHAAHFSAKLHGALMGDAAAQSVSDGEIVGLDFDPFLFSQDPDERYEIGEVTGDASRCWVPVYGLSDGKRRSQPSVLAEVGRESSAWVFANFHAPEGKDLLSVLKILRENREKQPKAAVPQAI